MPKPKGYHRLELPPAKYVTFNRPNCPFTFEYPDNATLETDAIVHQRIGKNIVVKPIDDCIFNLRFKEFVCKWHFTTHTFDNQGRNYSRTFEDHRALVYKHAKKGNILETPLKTSAGRGILYELYGEVGNAAQLYFSDSSRYAIETAIYFDFATKNDSLQPVIDRMKADLLHLVKTLRWK